MRKMGGMYRQYQRELKVEKELRMAVALKIMKEQGVRYTREVDCIHTIVEGPQGLIDYWPTTGKWICRATGARMFGVGLLVKFIKEDK